MQTSLCPYCFQVAESEICPHCGNIVSYDQDPTHLPAGYTLAGSSDYLLGAAIGQGGFGITYAALDMKTNQRVAVKEYFPTYCSSRINGTNVDAYRGQEDTYIKGRERFLDEARMLKSLSDLNSVVNVLDFFEANNSAYLVMEYLDGLSLKDQVEKNGKLPAQQFITQLKPLMADMEKMHQRGVVHRDIAPDNIILLPDGRLKLIDFGAARSYVGDKSMTVVVKKGFAPVEQYMRKGSNASTDVYALAATIYYCITGIIPPDSAERQYGEAELRAPTVLGVELSKVQELGLEKALTIQPKDRTQSVAELARALAQIPKPVTPKPEKHKPEKAKAAPQKEKAPKPQTVPKETADSPKRIKWWIPVAAVAAVLCIVMGFLFSGKEEPSAPVAPVHMEAGQTEAQPVVQLSAEAVKYNEAVDLFKNEEYGKAAIAFGKLGDYRDAKQISKQIWDAISERETFATFGRSDRRFVGGVRNDGTVVATAYNDRWGQCNVSDWTDVVAISTTYDHTVGLRSDGTVVVAGPEAYQREFSEWTDVVAISAKYAHTVGLHSDGTVVATGDKNFGQCNVSDWTDVVAISASRAHTVGLRSDGTVVATGDNSFGQCNVSDWTDIVEVYTSGDYTTVGLCSDGTVVAAGQHKDVLSKWTDIVAVAVGDRYWGKQIISHIVGLRRDGTVVTAGDNSYGQCKVENWKEIIAIHATGARTVGLRNDGTVLAIGKNSFGECNIKDWTDVTAVYLDNDQTFGMRSDGTVLAAGHSVSKVNEWTDIKLPADRDALLAAIELDYITDSD